MGRRKYELTSESKVTYWGNELHRIRALIDFGNVHAGDLGGWIEKEGNLAHDGLAWVYDDAEAYGDATVYGNAKVYEFAKVFGSSEVYGNAKVHGFAWAYDSSWVCGNANVYGDVRIFGKTRLCRDADVSKLTHYLTIVPFGDGDNITTFFRAKDKSINVWCGYFEGDIKGFAMKSHQSRSENCYAKAFMLAIKLSKATLEDVEV